MKNIPFYSIDYFAQFPAEILNIFFFVEPL